MENILKKIGKISSFASRYIGIIIIAFSCLAFFWRDGFAWMTNYTSVFLGVIMFGMGLTIRLEDFRAIFSRPKEVIIGAVAQYTIMPVVAWVLCKVMNLPADLALGVILVGCCPGGTASNVITYIAGGDVALSVGMTIVSTLAAPVMTPFLVYILAGAWVKVSFWAMVLSVVKVILVPVLLGILLRTLAGDHVDKVSDVMPLISVVAIVMIIGGIVAINAEKILSCGVLVLGVVAIHNFCGMMLGFLAAKICFLMSLFSSIFFSKVHNGTIGFLDVNIVKLVAQVHLDSGNILLAKLRLLNFLFLCKTNTLCLVMKGVDPINHFTVHIILLFYL